MIPYRINVGSVTLQIYKRAPEKCLTKTLAGITANVAHSLDASVLHETLANSKISNLNTIHDAYQVHANFCDQLEIDVKKAFIRVFEEDDLLLCIYNVACEQFRLRDLDPNKPIRITEGRKKLELFLPKPPKKGT